LPSYVIPIALMSVLVLVAATSYLSQARLNPGLSSATVAPATAAPATSAQATLAPTGSVHGASSPPGPSVVPLPDVAADLPDTCPRRDLGQAFRAQATFGGSKAQIIAVRCDAGQSYGPLVYLATPAGGWRLAGHGELRPGYAFAAVSGPISGPPSVKA